jgi:hypothetical protein
MTEHNTHSMPGVCGVLYESSTTARRLLGATICRKLALSIMKTRAYYRRIIDIAHAVKDSRIENVKFGNISQFNSHALQMVKYNICDDIAKQI